MSPPVVKGISASGSDQDLPPLSGRCDRRRDQTCAGEPAFCVALMCTHARLSRLCPPSRDSTYRLVVPLSQHYVAMNLCLRAWAYGHAILPEEDGRLSQGDGEADSLP